MRYSLKETCKPSIESFDDVLDGSCLVKVKRASICGRGDAVGGAIGYSLISLYGL